MDSYTDEYCMIQNAYFSPNGTGWKPRKLSAKRDFPKGFDEVTTRVHLSVSNDEFQNISTTLSKRRKVAVVRDFPIGMSYGYKENVGPVESEEGSTDSRTFDDLVSSGNSINGEMYGSNYEETDIDVLIKKVIRDLAYESTKVVSDDLVRSDMESVSSESSNNKSLLGSDYGHTDLNTDKGRTPNLLFEGAKVVSDDLDSASSGSSVNREMFGSGYAETDLGELIKTKKRTFCLPYEGANVVSDDYDTASSGSSINRERRGSDFEETDLDKLIKTKKRMCRLPYEGANVVSDDWVSITSSGSSINRERRVSDFEESDLDKLIKTKKRMFRLPYEGANVVSDDWYSVSSGSSINRETLNSDYEETDPDKLVKSKKRTFRLPYEGANVVSDDYDSASSDEYDSASSGYFINRERPGSNYEDSDLNELIKTDKRSINLPHEGARVVSDDLDCMSSRSSTNRETHSPVYEDTNLDNVEKAQSEADTMGPCTELKIYGASVKDITWNQSQGQMQIQLSIDNLQNYSISIKPSGKENGIHNRAVKRITTNHTHTRKQLHSRNRKSFSC